MVVVFDVVLCKLKHRDIPTFYPCTKMTSKNYKNVPPNSYFLDNIREHQLQHALLILGTWLCITVQSLPSYEVKSDCLHQGL